MTSLLIDFGASRVKCGIVRDDAKEVCDIRFFDPCSPQTTDNGKFEVSVSALSGLFTRILMEYREFCSVGRILICSEMHGFALLDAKNRPVSDYVSWKDERDAQSDQSAYKALTAAITPSDYLSTTGMTCAPSMPIVNLMRILMERHLSFVKVVSLPELIIALVGKPADRGQETLTAGIGLYDINRHEPFMRLIDFIQETTNTSVALNAATRDGLDVAGEVDGIPVYTAVGDLQSALIGAGNSATTVSINLGTGSQVTCIGLHQKNSPELEVRPFFQGLQAQTITHIPSGRMLNAYIGFLESVNPHADFWSMLSQVSLDEMLQAPLLFELGVFRSAWRYSGGGRIERIGERNLTVDSYLQSLLKAYVYQYVAALPLFGDIKNRTVVMSGGIPGKLPVIGKAIEALTGLSVKASQSREEALDGLAKLSTTL